MPSGGLAPFLRRLARVAGEVAAGLALLWSLGAIYYCVAWPRGAGLVVVLVLAGLYVHLRIRGGARASLRYAVFVFACGLALLLARGAASAADWSPLHERLPRSRVHGTQLEIENFRDARHARGGEGPARWTRRSFDLDKLRSVDFVLVPFQGFELGAHTFVSFGFEGGERLAVSIEARRERGEGYGVLRGIYRQHELCYVVGSERDVLGLRSHVRGDTVYAYPMRADAAQRKALLLALLEDANALRERPAFYHTILTNCTTRLRAQLGSAMGQEMPWSYEVLLPSLSDALVHRQGWIDTELSLAQARERFRVRTAAGDLEAPDFGERVRARMR